MKNIKNFIERWKDKGDEKSDTQKFWIEFLETVCGVDEPTKLIEFEKRVEIKHKNFIDVYIPSTRIIIEQKSIDIDLEKAAKQSDGSFKTPFEQAKRYGDWLPDSERARWIITCNFQEFNVHDMERPTAEPEIIFLENLEKEWRKFLFLIDLKALSPKEIHELEISIKAGELVGRFYDALKIRYENPDSKNSLRSLNILCVRIVFLLYAEDSGLFPKSSFHDFLKKQNNPRRALIDLFEVLAQKIDERDFYLDDELKNFPYVNGGLFEEKNIEIPKIEGEPLEIILREMSEGFDWSSISPTIFGAVFEATLNPETRRSGGMHYTSIENIHKVIDPLFLKDLNAELENIFLDSKIKTRTKKLIEFQKKLSSLKFLDPACGSGNFLTETFLCLRRLENQILIELTKQQINFAAGDFSPIQVKISQFFGIEINDFAVAVAKTALWIAEAQMWNETKRIVQNLDDFLPLKSFNNITEADALKFDWADLIKPGELNFIMGNPPFRGARVMDAAQKAELNEIFKGWKNAGNLDYVSCWYKKTADLMKENRNIKAALVSTNSITQGDSVATLWKPLFDDGIKFNFAWQTFKWSSEASEKAHVHCVIIGFSYENSDEKFIYEIQKDKRIKKIRAKNINAYLVDAPDVFVESRNKPLCDVPEIGIGNKPIDGGNYLFKEDEMKEFINKEPLSEKFFHKWYGADEFINQRPRYCLYLGECPPAELRKMPECLKRVEAVREYRLKSPSPGTVKLADTPRKFHVTNMPEGNYIVIPESSSERRKYIPMGFMDSSVLCSNALKLIPDATLYHFGILTSSVHMAWMRTTAGRLKSDYRYSKDIVYNNFIWPSPTEKQKSKIENAAKKILDARNLYPESSLADLYDPLTMPEELLKAHKENDAAVCEAYRFEKNISESEIVSKLFFLYSNFNLSRS